MRDSAQLLLLDGRQVGELLSADDALQAVREAFVLHSRGEGRVFPVVREPLATGGVFGIKSGIVTAQDLLGFKAAGFWPKNRQQGGEPHQATILLIDPLTGRPQCVVDGNMVTTLRTGAAGGLGLVQLARPGSQRLCVFGAGVQAAVQLDFALRLMPSLRKVRYITHDKNPSADLETRFKHRCELAHASDANAAVAASEVVITATPGGGALFDIDAVQPGTHLTCVGADTAGKRELPEGLLERARLVVDDRTQARQIGEAQWAPGVSAIEIGELLAGEKTLDRAVDDITVFDMTGLALQDLTVVRLLYSRATAKGIGTRVPWPW